jgi:hypothetical protein
MMSCFHQLTADGRADQACSADDQDVHSGSPRFQ